MDIEQIKIEPLIIVKEKLETDGIEKLEVHLENEEKSQVVEELSFGEKKPSKIESEFDEVTLHKCCCCQKERKAEEMVSTRESHEKFSKWYKVLGEKLFENAHPTKPLMVCRSHFDDEFGNSRINYVIRKCCYCGKTKVSSDMTRVQKGTNYFNKWVEILGNKFYGNFKMNKTGFICRNHFNIQWYGSRPQDVLPVADLDTKLNKTKKLEMELNNSTDETPERTVEMNLSTKMRLEKKHKCEYCGELKLLLNLTPVPKSPNHLKKWGDILGEEFYRKVITKSVSYICRSHFDVEWEKIRPRNLLPCIKPVQMLSNEVKNEKFIDSHSEIDSLSPPIVYTDQIKVELLTFVKQKLEINRLEDEEKPQTIEEFRLGEEKPSTSDNFGKNGIEFNEPHLPTCSFCKERKPLENMVQTPETEKEIIKWSKIFGATSVKNFAKGSMVCRSHFDDEFGDSILTDDHLKESEISDELRCCYCKKLRVIKVMTVVSKDNHRFNDWARVLGEKFHEHFRKHKRGFICHSHFYNECHSPKPKKRNLDENLIKKKYLMKSEPKIKQIAKRMCYYCGERKLKSDLTHVPQNATTLREWANILGEEFYKRAAGKGVPICRKHFNVQWGDRRPNGLLPSASYVPMVSNDMGEEEMAQSESLDKTSLFMEVKLEEPDICEDSDEKPHHLLDVGFQHPMNFNIQERPSDQKRIKLEVKEEEE